MPNENLLKKEKDKQNIVDRVNEWSEIFYVKMEKLGGSLGELGGAWGSCFAFSKVEVLVERGIHWVETNHKYNSLNNFLHSHNINITQLLTLAKV